MMSVVPPSLVSLQPTGFYHNKVPASPDNEAPKATVKLLVKKLKSIPKHTMVIGNYNVKLWGEDEDMISRFPRSRLR